MSTVDSEPSAEDLAAEQRVWIEEMIQEFVGVGIDEEAARGGVEWGIHWMQDHVAECVRRFGEDKARSKEEFLEILEASYRTSFHRTPSVPRFPFSGMPALGSTKVARETLIYTAPPEEREVIKGLLDELTASSKSQRSA